MQMKLSEGSKFFNGGACDVQKWRGILASGTAILCFSNVGQVSSLAAAIAVLAINGSALIYAEPFTRKLAQDDFLPSVHVDISQGTQILHHIQSSKDPVVQVIPERDVIGRSPAPFIAYFSSRGPSSLAPNVLKPDIAAPGVNILAAWPPKSSPTMLPFDGRSIKWNLDSGTSMSCPHVSGIVALLKSAHPDWSPAALKSALMTTAYNIDTSQDNIFDGGTMKPSTPFDIGAGHVNPTKAFNPGLVYDMGPRDHVLFLCSIGYTQDQIQRMVLASPAIDTSCPEEGVSDIDLNYPAIVVSDLRSTKVVKRTLQRTERCNNNLYRATTISPNGVRITIWPKYLDFRRQREKISYYVTLTPLKYSEGRFDFGEIVWSNGYHKVRTPLIVRVNNAKVHPPNKEAMTHPSA